MATPCPALSGPPLSFPKSPDPIPSDAITPARFARQLVDGLQDHGLVEGIKATGGFVQQHQVGMAQEHASQADCVGVRPRTGVRPTHPPGYRGRPASDSTSRNADAFVSAPRNHGVAAIIRRPNLQAPSADSRGSCRRTDRSPVRAWSARAGDDAHSTVRRSSRTLSRGRLADPSTASAV